MLFRSSRARELGMNDTHFAEPTGLSPKNTSTALDAAKLLTYAAGNELLASVTGQGIDSIIVYPRGVTRRIVSTNQLIGSIVKVLAGKTGYLEESLYNLANVIKLKNGHEIVVVTLGSLSSESRFQDNKILSIWAEKTWQWP